MMDIAELEIREKANDLHEIDKQELLTVFSFNNAVVNGSDKNGNPLVHKPSDIANFAKMRKKITGEYAEDEAKVNKYQEMSDRAKKAREEALKELRKGGN